MYKFNKAKLEGVYLIEPHRFSDERGSITKTFHRPSFEDHGISCAWGESIITLNKSKGVVRGFHYQRPPYAQAKMFYCVKGAFFNMSLDIRRNSPTYGQYETFDLTEKKNVLLYIPEGIANAYCIMEDDTIVSYNLTSEYMPSYEGGINFKSLEIELPFKNKDIIVSEKDKKWPSFGGFETPFV